MMNISPYRPGSLVTQDSTANSRSSADTSQVDSARQADQLNRQSAAALHQALQTAKQSAPLTTSVQSVKNKAGVLRQRLEMLRTMIASAAPAQAKALAKQLQDIAKQLGALAAELKQSDSGASTSSAAAISSQADTAAGSSADAAGAGAAAAGDSSSADSDAQAAAQAATDTASSEDGKVDGKNDQPQDSTDQPTNNIQAHGADNEQSLHVEEHARKNEPSDAHKLLLDLRKMLKAAWQELKPKLDSNDPAVRSVEDQFRETDHQLAEISNTTYDVAGSINIDGGNADSGNTGTAISVTA